MNMKMPPTEATAPKRNAFFTIRRKAFQAEAQKFLLVSAIWMYAFFVINFTQRSRQANR
jgi:hypothetical protein